MSRVTYAAMSVLLLAACEGTWASPNQVHLHPMHGSRISGIAGISISANRLRQNMPVGTDIDAQFPGLNDPKPYVLQLQRGSCTQPASGAIAERFALYPGADDRDGIESSAHVDVPIHSIMKGGYYVSLVDRRTKRVVSCGDLHTDRPW